MKNIILNEGMEAKDNLSVSSHYLDLNLANEKSTKI